jgi:hypothetical protein
MSEGPAQFFDIAALLPTLEPPLSEADTQIEVQGLVAIDKDLNLQVAAVQQSVNELSTATFDLHQSLNIAESELYGQSQAPPDTAQQSIQEGAFETELGLAAALEAIPTFPPAVTTSSSQPLPPAVAPGGDQVPGDQVPL